MSEYTAPPSTFFNKYPLLFGDVMPDGFEHIHELNRSFVARLIPPTAEGYSEFDHLIAETCAKALTEADHRLGRDTSKLGVMCTKEEDGLWTTLPTFYHNGDGTRLAMSGTKQYMDFVNQREGDRSPYRNRRIYLATMVTAAFDDLVFGDFGRGGDEIASATIAEEYLRSVGAPEDFAEAVRIGIEASTFDEVKKKQRYNPIEGRDLFGGIGTEPIQRASLIGDLWALGTPQATANTFMLLVENLWKRDSGFDMSDNEQKRKRHSILRNAAMNDYFAPPEMGVANQWSSLSDFFTLAQNYSEVRIAFAQELIENENFVLDVHRYERSGDMRIDGLMMPGKVQNARLQKLLGRAIRENHMTIAQAFHCALSYADAVNWRIGDHGATLGDVTPGQISKLLLTVRNPAEFTDPVDADEFFAAYKSDLNLVW